MIEAQGAIPDPNDSNYMIVYNDHGEVMRRELSSDARRRGITDTQLSAEPPNWLKIQYAVFKRFFQLVLPDYETFIVEAREGGSDCAKITMYADSARDYISFGVQGVKKYSSGVVTKIPLTYVNVLRTISKRPGAYLTETPAIFADQFITNYGARLAARKGYVIPVEFIGKIKAPRCPFCLQDLALSNLMNTTPDSGSVIERHLWICRLCSSPEQVPLHYVGAVARRLKNDQDKERGSSDSDDHDARLPHGDATILDSEREGPNIDKIGETLSNANEESPRKDLDSSF